MATFPLKSSEKMGPVEAITALEAVATNPKASDEEVDKAEEMLRSMANDQAHSENVRNGARAALERIESKRTLATRMGVRARARAPYMEGNRQVLPFLTPDEARAVIARRHPR